MAPFTPFLAEYFYQNLKKFLPGEVEESVHYLMFPEPVKEAINPRIEEAVSRMQAVIQLGRTARERRKISLKFPLNRATVISKDAQYRTDIESLKAYVLEELNIKELVTTADDSSVGLSAKPDFGVLGKRLRKDLPKVQQAVQALTNEQLQKLLNDGSIVIEGHNITAEELRVTKGYKGDNTTAEANWNEEVVVVLDVMQSEAMKDEGNAREVMNRIQKLRKKAGIQPTDPIEVFYRVDATSELAKVITKKLDFITNGIGVGLSPLSATPQYSIEFIHEETTVLGTKLLISIRRLSVALSPKFLSSLADDAERNDLQTLVYTREYFSLLKQMDSNSGKFTVSLNDKQYTLELGKDIFKRVCDMLK